MSWWTSQLSARLPDRAAKSAHGRPTRNLLSSRFGSLESRINARFDSMQRTMIQLFAVMFAAFVGLISAQTVLLLALL